MKTSILFKAFSLASAVTISSFGMCLMNQEFVSAAEIKPEGWCVHSGARIVYGNFDGKGGIDALCYDRAGSKWINYANGERWYTKSSWCTHSGSYIAVLQMTSKNRTADLLCRDVQGGRWTVNATEKGTFNF
ncbi:hypothetical protein [Nostoc favosum]|uniref:Uncharacterized protein n=1 Tax=Nostoc favosum CHAB5714 TaxID=2780399 RepID=A0ABS8IK62_9NOSO|nr:hypothetical protein [Nostoc favosum]MCC5604675.1 hypothetical protein [Nostoc favosum CHAB5714]